MLTKIIWANENNLDLAIRGGGHSYSGASSTEGVVGITSLALSLILVDLSRLRKVTVDPENKLAYAQGGALWNDFNCATIAHGLATPGGLVGHTGIGGVIVGGGRGYLTGQHGLSIDNLKEATVVTAKGDIVKASETSNPDLFWGIRGTESMVYY